MGENMKYKTVYSVLIIAVRTFFGKVFKNRIFRIRNLLEYSSLICKFKIFSIWKSDVSLARQTRSQGQAQQWKSLNIQQVVRTENPLRHDLWNRTNEKISSESGLGKLWGWWERWRVWRWRWRKSWWFVQQPFFIKVNKRREGKEYGEHCMEFYDQKPSGQQWKENLPQWCWKWTSWV